MTQLGEVEKISASEAGRLKETGSFFSAGEINLTWVIFAFGLITIAAYCYISKGNRESEQTSRLFVVIVIVFGTLLVVSSTYATEQIAPVVGLFGTIAGYLLGRGEKHD